MHPFPSNPHFTYTDFQPAPYEGYFDDVVAVLDSVKLLFSNYFVFSDNLSLSVINNHPDKDSPEIIKEICSIYLTVDSIDKNGEPGCYWSQFIFQFAHEFCHYMTFGHVTQTMRWFEETICELASHFFLLKSAEQWSITPPYPHWKYYSNFISSYEINRRKQVTLFLIKDLWNPISNIISSLQVNEYQRTLNNYLAVELLPYFIEHPNLWKTVHYMPQFKANYTFVQNIQYLQSLSKEPIFDIMLKLSQS